jgi:hypothetical protein
MIIIIGRYKMIKINNLLKINKIIMYLFILYLLADIVTAHPPSKLDINYDIESRELIVNITHSVTNQDHYIESVEIYINGGEYGIYDYDSQPSSSSFSYSYNINASDGDFFKIIARCNQFGTLTRELTVGGDNNSPSTSGFISMLLIISILLITIFLKRRK